MALIVCVECGKQVSSLAVACPGCGCPLSSEAPSNTMPKRPDLPTNLQVFTSVSLFSFTPGIVWGKVSAISDFPGVNLGCSASVDRYEEGIGLSAGGKYLRIHYSQIASVQFTKAASVKETSKSILGRAAVGAVFLGPVGAIVGGLSGTGKNSKPVDAMQIMFWSDDFNRYCTLVIESERSGLESYSACIAKESEKYKVLHEALVKLR